MVLKGSYTSLAVEFLPESRLTDCSLVTPGNFTFVNTSSREDAVKAREMLQGNMINGGPLRINFAKETGRLGTSFDL